MTTDPNDAIDANLHKPDSYQDAAVNRKVLHMLATHSDLRQMDAPILFKHSQLYPKRDVWLDFAYKFFLSIGALMMLAGIIFFFAYNWSGLHKFAKLATVQVGILGIAAGIIWYKKDDYAQKIALTILSVLVGVYFAVFGQIYQTGANAYDFFLGWTIFIAAWVSISGFPFLWLFFLFLINLTVGAYVEQVLRSWDDGTMLVIFAVINLTALVIWEFVTKLQREEIVNLWCLRIIGIGLTYTLTANVVYYIFDDYGRSGTNLVGVFFYIIGAGAGIYYYKQVQDIVFSAIIPFSIMVIVDCLIINMASGGDSFGVLLLVTLLTIGGTTGLVFYLLQLYKSWNNPIDNPSKTA